jgi:site-specific recombinase XerD
MKEGSMLAPRTEHEYRWYVRRREADGMPTPATWIERFPGSHQRRNARAALVWWYRTQLGRTLRVPVVVSDVKVPEAFSDVELAQILEAARVTHPRASAVLLFLYSTGARVSEAAGVLLEDVTSSHIILRETKRSARNGGRTKRAIPLGPRSREAVAELRSLPPGRVNNLIGVRAHTVQDWCRVLSKGTGLYVHAHKFRATFATHLLQRGVPIHEVQRLLGHRSVTTTMRYAAVADERLVAAVALL